jgi:hypothetical protein
MEIIEISRSNLKEHARLLKICFPDSNLTPEYLDWLYFANPAGNVVGYDAVVGSDVIGHYACIPIHVGNRMGLLSVNTATHPDFRSKGIYQSLATLTYEKSWAEFSFVVGVANSKSAKTFIDRLGFTEVGRLNLRFGKILPPSQNTRTWSRSEIEWRIKSPKQRMLKRSINDNLLELSLRPHKFPFKIKTTVSVRPYNEIAIEDLKKSMTIGFTLDWVKGYQPIIRLPERLKPSPLVLILKSLDGSITELDSWSFPDFDAF